MKNNYSTASQITIVYSINKVSSKSLIRNPYQFPKIPKSQSHIIFITVPIICLNNTDHIYNLHKYIINVITQLHITLTVNWWWKLENLPHVSAGDRESSERSEEWRCRVVPAASSGGVEARSGANRHWNCYDKWIQCLVGEVSTGVGRDRENLEWLAGDRSRG